MKRIITFTLLTLLIISPLFQKEASASIAGQQFEKELNYWINKDVIQADGQGKYNPQRTVTRGEFASYISRALALPNSTKYTFKDLPTNSSRTVEIQNAAGAEILAGYPDGTFKADTPITRQQMAGMIEKALRYMDVSSQPAKLDFKDAHQISPNTVNAVAVSVHLGIIEGDTTQANGVYFYPLKNATIAHASAFLYRMFEAAGEFESSKPEKPEQPEKPDVDVNEFTVSTISNKQLKPTTATYKNYDAALAAYNASSSIRAIQKNNKVIKMKSGRAYVSNNASNTTTLYKNHTFKSADVAMPIQKGREIKYVGSSEDRVLLSVGGITYYAKHSEVDLVPTELVTGYDYYEVDKNRLLIHSTYDNTNKSRGVYTVGPAAPSMNTGKRYTSLEGVHFTEVGTNKKITYYPYFQFQSVRQPTSYTGVELEKFIAAALAERDNLNLAKYKDITTKSKLIGLGQYLKAIESTHNVNAMFILASAIHESDYGMSNNAQTKNNIFGIRVFDSSPELGEVYEDPKNSVDAFIREYANKNYATPSGAYAHGAVPGNKAVGFNIRYASDPNWGSKIAGHMWRIDTLLGKKDINNATLGMITYSGNSGVNVRTSPEVKSNNVLFRYKQRNPGLNSDFGYPIVIIEERKGSDGYMWYKVLADTNPDLRNPSSNYGWIRSDLVKHIK